MTERPRLTGSPDLPPRPELPKVSHAFTETERQVAGGDVVGTGFGSGFPACVGDST